MDLLRTRKLHKLHTYTYTNQCSAEVVSILEQEETNEKKDDDEEKKKK